MVVVGEYCQCEKAPGKVFWVDGMDTMIHDGCGKMIYLPREVRDESMQIIYPRVMVRK